MKLLYQIHKSNKPAFPNFGDELNLLIWPKLAPGLFDESESVLFVGIGTVLDKTLPESPLKIIFGAGNGYAPPPRIDSTYRIYCVRGPLTAKMVGLSAELAVTDPAILINQVYSVPVEQKRGIALMGHYTSAQSADWTFACEELGFTYIDPLWPMHRILAMISQSELVVTEAMHGAIVADALRVPWVPVITNVSACPFKWRDWTSSMELDYNPIVIPALWDRCAPPTSSIGRLKRWLKRRQFISRLSPGNLRSRTRLSSDRVLEARLCRLHELFGQLKRDAIYEGWGQRRTSCDC
ncbi:polysaccharide pyruvyl transferase family protein [Anatilimnocola sp. NA78]|uniref:polysaccharide pyruvyl transferase family protein n=1 Tax=Anatilimnocola sp. NA78 TaxID=3415683 RepID=UPI003CE516BE